MVANADFEKVRAYLNTVSQKLKLKIDKWESPYVFSTTLPHDYKTEHYPKKYRNFDVLLLNLIDIVATKIARLNERDVDDIKIIITTGITVGEITERFNHVLNNNGFPNKEIALKNLNLFTTLFSA